MSSRYGRLTCSSCSEMVGAVSGNRPSGYNLLSPDGWPRAGRGVINGAMDTHRQQALCLGEGWTRTGHRGGDDTLLTTWKEAAQERAYRNAMAQQESDGG